MRWQRLYNLFVVALLRSPLPGRFLTVLRQVPAYRRYFRVKLAADRNPEDQGALARVADSKAVVRIKDLVSER
jgi:hypothetical protein